MVTEVISLVVFRVRIDGWEVIIPANRMQRDPRHRPSLALSATTLGNLSQFSGFHYRMADPLYATSIHLTGNGVHPTEMDYLTAHGNRGWYTDHD